MPGRGLLRKRLGGQPLVGREWDSRWRRVGSRAVHLARNQLQPRRALQPPAARRLTCARSPPSRPASPLLRACRQVAIGILPISVLASWAMGKDFLLDFDAFSILMLTGGRRGAEPPQQRRRCARAALLARSAATTLAGCTPKR